MGDSERDYLAAQRKKKKKSGATLLSGDQEAREARSKAIKRQQSRKAVRPPAKEQGRLKLWP